MSRKLTEDAILGLNQSLFEESNRLAKNPIFSRYAKLLDQPKYGLSKMQKASTIMALKNFVEWAESRHIPAKRILMEETTSSDIANYIHHGFQLLTAIMPSLLAHEFVSVQPQSRRTGEIFYMTFKYGTTKGNVTAGSTALGWATAGNLDQYYSSPTIYSETYTTSAPGGTKDFNHTCLAIPVVAGTFTATDGVENFTDNADNTLTGSAGGTGTINYNTGEVTLHFNANVLIGVRIYCTYDTDFEANPDNIGELNLDIVSDSVKATDRALRLIYSLDSAYDLKQAFGLEAGEELTTAAASEIRADIDQEVFGDIYNGAGDTNTPWSQTPDTGVSFLQHKFQLLDFMIEASTQIKNLTRRAQGNFIVAGTRVAAILQSLEPRFKSADYTDEPGPQVIGKIDRFTVIMNPAYNQDVYTVGYKGKLFVDSGYIYAPYLPLFATDPVALDDMRVRRGLRTAYSKKLVNPNFYIKGAITA